MKNAVIAKVSYRRRALAPIISLDQPGRLRFANLMALLSVSHQTLYSQMKDGSVPYPDGYDGSRPYWFTSTIKPLLERAQS